MFRWNLTRGEPVIYCKSKYSSRPGPRARAVEPSPRGEDYLYQVDKYWVVAETPNNDTVVLQTRRGKRHVVRRDDPRLRRPTIWERFRFGSRFPSPPTPATS
jgi:hypothetical protein